MNLSSHPRSADAVVARQVRATVLSRKTFPRYESRAKCRAKSAAVAVLVCLAPVCLAGPAFSATLSSKAYIT